MVETGGVLRFLPRGLAPQLALDVAALAAPAREGEGAFKLTRAQETELPDVVKLVVIEALSDYRQVAVEARRLGGASDRVAEARLPIVMEAADAQALAESWLMESWVARERAEFLLPPSRLALDPGDVVTLSVPGRSLDLRLESVTDAGLRRVSAVAAEASLYDLRRGPARGTPLAPPAQYGTPETALLDLPELDDTAAPQWPRFAAFADPWPGTVALYRGAGDEAALQVLASVAAIMGETLTPLGAGPEGRFDRAAALEVQLFGGVLESRSERDVLDGANLLAIQNEAGGWELLQFSIAELIGTRCYRLAGLLRGQMGTEGEIRASLAPGARVVRLDGAALPVPLALDERNRLFTWRAGPSGFPVGDPVFRAFDQSLAGVGLRPLSPVQVRAARPGPGDDIRVTWIRRTRTGGDAWGETEVPLGEAFERYEIDILDGAAVKRTLSATVPEVVYAAADQVADFGAPVVSLSMRVSQLSEVFGRGAQRTTVLTL